MHGQSGFCAKNKCSSCMNWLTYSLCVTFNGVFSSISSLIGSNHSCHLEVSGTVHVGGEVVSDEGAGDKCIGVITQARATLVQDWSSSCTDTQYKWHNLKRTKTGNRTLHNNIIQEVKPCTISTHRQFKVQCSTVHMPQLVNSEWWRWWRHYWQREAQREYCVAIVYSGLVT